MHEILKIPTSMRTVTEYRSLKTINTLLAHGERMTADRFLITQELVIERERKIVCSKDLYSNAQ